MFYIHFCFPNLMIHECENGEKGNLTRISTFQTSLENKENHEVEM